MKKFIVLILYITIYTKKTSLRKTSKLFESAYEHSYRFKLDLRRNLKTLLTAYS